MIGLYRSGPGRGVQSGHASMLVGRDDSVADARERGPEMLLRPLESRQGSAASLVQPADEDSGGQEDGERARIAPARQREGPGGIQK
jgi:hypothetical protein